MVERNSTNEICQYVLLFAKNNQSYVLLQRSLSRWPRNEAVSFRTVHAAAGNSWQNNCGPHLVFNLFFVIFPNAVYKYRYRISNFRRQQYSDLDRIVQWWLLLKIFTYYWTGILHLLYSGWPFWFFDEYLVVFIPLLAFSCHVQFIFFPSYNKQNPSRCLPNEFNQHFKSIPGSDPWASQKWLQFSMFTV